MNSPIYDLIGVGYRNYRKPDPRIGAQLAAALGDARSVLNVGAGVGSYESTDREFLALEPSRVMIRQRAPTAAPVVQGVVERLPFETNSFDAVQGVLTLHHWRDQAAGLAEVCRVARERAVFLSWVGYCQRFWLFDYFPEIEDMDHAMFPTVQWLRDESGCAVTEVEVPVPADCSDGFMCAYWARPQAYLDPGVRAAISSFAKLENIETRLQRLADDLESGAWHKRYGELQQKPCMDFGYRVLVLTL